MPPKVSVIVPVYNTEKYLEKCLGSLVSQTLKELEIIIVNDGSPDGSQGIIDRFAGKYPDRVVAFRQENKGLGAVRNIGVKHAGGKHIGFVDSDDWVQPDMFELLHKTAAETDADIVICDFYIVDEVSMQCRAAEIWNEESSRPQTVAQFVLESTNPAIACNKLFKQELLLHTPFPCIYYEDVGTIPVVLSNCEKISYVTEPLYYYLKRGGAITAQQSDPRNLGVIDAWKRCLSECNPRYKEEVAYAVYFSLCYFLDAKRAHIAEYVMFFIQNNAAFKDNHYIETAIQSGGLADLFVMFGKYLK